MYEIALSFLNEIESLGYTSYIVGGYARDKYLGLNATDIDICTNMKVDDMKKYFECTGGFVKYGSMKIKYKNVVFEVTTFRQEDEYLDYRHPKKIYFKDKLEDDLKRRDFIINTLCIDKNGNYVDLLGARQDIDNKIIRVVGNTALKLKEDPLRILRAIRFSIDLDFKLDEEIIKAIKENNKFLNKISKIKIEEEINKCKNKEKLISVLSNLYGNRLKISLKSVDKF